MADELAFSVDTKALDVALSGLSIKTQTKILANALSKGGAIATAAIKANAAASAKKDRQTPTPKSNSLPEEIMREDIHAVVKVSEGGANCKIGGTELAGYVIRWQNNGWKLTSHGRKRNRRQIKAIPGRYFIEGGMDESKQEVLDAMIEAIEEGIRNAD
jgi:hypothetical protein